MTRQAVELALRPSAEHHVEKEPKMRHHMRVIAVAAVAAMTLSGCGRDKAGGDADRQVRTLTLANGNHSPGGQLTAWADAVERRSNGGLKIKIESGWRLGETAYESGIVRDVKAGKADLGWVGARVFDRLGDWDFEALLAPLTVDSYELEQRVFTEGIPAEMAAGLDSIGITGVGVLPGPLFRMLGDTPFVRPAAFRGKDIAIQDSALAAQTLTTLGATTTSVPSGARLRGVDGYVQHIGSVWGNNYQQDFGHYTTNVNMWPRPLVLFANSASFDQLSETDRDILSAAADDALAASITASHAEDSDAMALLCKTNLTFDSASDAQLAALQRAVKPVLDRLRQDDRTAAWLDRIEMLKQQVAARPDALTCPGNTDPPGTTLGIPDGTYVRKVTRSDIEEAGMRSFPVGTWSLTFDDGLLTKQGPAAEDVDSYTYTTFHGKIRAEGPVTMTANFSVNGDTLTFREIAFPGCDDCAMNPEDQCVRADGKCPGAYLGAFGGFGRPWVRQK